MDVTDAENRGRTLNQEEANTRVRPHALTRAALALPILILPARAGAAEIGLAYYTYKERGLMEVREPIVWAKGRIGEDWEVSASAAVDIVSGASPELVTNASGEIVQTVTGASVQDRRHTGDVKVSRRLGDAIFSVSRLISKEEDYVSHAYGLEARYDLNQRNTTLIAGYGRANDRISSMDDPTIDEPRRTHEYMAGIVQVLSPLAVVQSTLVATQGSGWFNDPYKLTLTFFAGGIPASAPDRRPSSRESIAWLTRYRRHVPAADGTLQADYRFYRDDWGIRSHTLELGWEQSLGDRWSLRPALRYYTQRAADFYSPVLPSPDPPIHSSDQRLGAFGGLSPSIKAIVRFEQGTTVEAMVGYLRNARSLRAGGEGSPAFVTLRAYYGVVSILHEF